MYNLLSQQLNWQISQVFLAGAVAYQHPRRLSQNFLLPGGYFGGFTVYFHPTHLCLDGSRTNLKHALVVMCKQTSTSSVGTAGTSKFMQNTWIELLVVHS